MLVGLITQRSVVRVYPPQPNRLKTNYYYNEKDKEKELLKHFDSIFDTDTLKTIKFDNMPMLKALFDYFEEFLYKPSPKYDKLRRQHIEISDLLEKSFNEAQQTLFKKYWEVGCEMKLEESEQLFCFGYIIAKKLEQESKIYNKQE